MGDFDADLARFAQKFVPNIQGSSYHPKWVRANPAEAAKWAALRDALLANPDATPPLPTLATRYGKALVAAAEEHMSVSRVVGVMQGTGQYPSTPPEEPPPPPPPPPPTGTLIWNGNLDTGNESQYDAYIRNAVDRWRVTSSAEGVTPRNGGYMARVECRQGENVSWPGSLSATLAIKAGLPVGIGQAYPDTYIGWSAWIPSDWPWASGAVNGMHSIFIEWHGTGSMSQAPFHWGIRWDTGRFFIDLHRAVTGYSPVFQPSFEALSDSGMANTWHDYVMRIKWSSGSDGVATFWRDGVQLFNWTGATSPLSGERIKFQCGVYVANAAPATKHIYLDEMRLGTTYSVVDPASY